MYNTDTPFDLLSCRLKSARRKKRLQKKDLEKQLIKHYRRQCLLEVRRRALPMIPLKHPYQQGWKRSFILRDDVKRGKDATFYQQLLDKINTVNYHHDKSFKVKKRRRGKKVYVVKPQFVRDYTEQEWRSPKLLLTEKEKTYFYRVETWCNKSRRTVVKYVYRDPWRFVLQVKPHMISEVKMIDVVLEQQIKELDNYLINHSLWHKMIKVATGRCQRRNYRRFRRIASQELKKQVLSEKAEQYDLLQNEEHQLWEV